MNEEVLRWKNKGELINIKEHNIFCLKEGMGPVLLILHGYPYNTFEWKFIWDSLVEHYTIIAFDYLGMGFSDKPKNHQYSFHEHAEFTNEVLGHYDIQHVHILSHDLGVSITQELIARESAKENKFDIHSIVYMNGGLFMDVYQPRFIQRLLSQSPKPIGKLLSKMLSKSKLDKTIKSVFGPETQPSEILLEQFWEILNLKEGKAIAYLIGRLVFDKVKHQSKWIKAMQETLIPMCFINGPFDPNSGIIMANRYKELIPNPNVKLLRKDIGHWPQIEDPHGVLNAYFEFRSSIESAKK